GPLIGHTQPIVSMAYALGDENVLYSVALDGYVDAWNVAQNRQLEPVHIEPDKLASDDQRHVRMNMLGSALSSDGKLLAIPGCQLMTGSRCSRGRVEVRETANGAVVWDTSTSSEGHD